MLGQLPNTTPDSFGSWLINLAAVMAIAAAGTGIMVALTKFFAPKKSSDMLVTRGELDVINNSLMTYATKMELEHRLAENQKAFKEFEAYAHQRFHDATDAQQLILLRLERLSVVQEMIAERNGIDVPKLPDKA